MQDLGPQKMQIEVVDDCSTDGDVKKLVDEVGAGRIQFFQQSKNKGSLRNFETCLNRAKGQYVHLLHGDDLVKPHFYNEIESLFSSYPTAGAAITNYNWINEHWEESAPNGPLQPQPGLLHNWLYRIASRQLVQPPAVVVKRTVYEKLGGFFAVHYGEDWEMWIRIAAHYDVAYSPKCLATYRGGHSTNISSQSVLSGQNITDLKKVISIAQAYLPAEKRAVLKAQAQKNFSVSFAKSSHRVYTQKGDEKAALQLAKGALKLHINPRTLYWCLRYLAARVQRRVGGPSPGGQGD